MYIDEVNSYNKKEIHLDIPVLSVYSKVQF